MRIDIIRSIARKELTLFFSSAIGYLFLAAFLAVTLFVFFWSEAFFARNLADVRPMFASQPLLLIFLAAAITMRMWSEERRMGTIEFVATVPASSWDFVLGKFAACCLLLGMALLLTLPLPMSVAFLGSLDWGPVFAGYLAALMLGAAYIAIGLFVSARTDSQMVSLIVTCLVCGAFYLIGASAITTYFGDTGAQWLRAFSSSARFESITRGVLDVRDLYFYVSIAGVFLTLNVFALERERWSTGSAPSGDSGRAAPSDAVRSPAHNKWRIGTALLVANLLLGNVWLSQIHLLRVDTTEGNVYTISDATKAYLGELREPLLLRGYFSEKTHPLLAPLAPRMKDLLQEYAVAGGDNVRVEIIDPASNPEAEDEANNKYGIQPVALQVSDRYQASVVNTYFDVVVSYGDEYEVLSFRDLIEVKARGEGDLDVWLRNPEFDLTRSIKRVLYEFQAGSSVFANMSDPVRFVGYVSDESRLPPELVTYRNELTATLDALVSESGGKFSYEYIDPDADGGLVAKEIAEQFGLQPMAMSFLDTTTFYFYQTLQGGDAVVQVNLPQGGADDAARRGLDEGLKRFATGLLKTVALKAPETPAPFVQQQMAQQGIPPGNQYTQLRDFLASDFDLEDADLSSGVVPANAEVLMVVDAEDLDEKERYAIDQFLMKGGTVVLSTSPFAARFTAQNLMATPRTSGLEDWLAHNGVVIEKSLVMDPQSAAFPVPVTRRVGNFSFPDLAMIDYPYLVDVRDDGLNRNSMITAPLQQLTMSWTSPLAVAALASPSGDSADTIREVVSDDGATITPLIYSSPGSWLSDSLDVMPKMDQNGVSMFVPTGEQSRRLLGVMLEGRFTSYFKDRENPLLAALETDAAGEDGDDTSDTSDPSEEVTSGRDVVGATITRSPESARLIVFASNDFLADQTVRLIGAADGTLYLNSSQMMANLVDSVLEDASLTAIRARGNFNRTLVPMDREGQTIVEYLNYLLAMLGVLVVWMVFRGVVRRRTERHRIWLSEAQPAGEVA